MNKHDYAHYIIAGLIAAAVIVGSWVLHDERDTVEIHSMGFAPAPEQAK